MTAMPALTLRLMPRLGKTWRRWAHRDDLNQGLALVPAILDRVPARPDLPPPATWQVQRADWTLTSTVIVAVGPTGAAPAAVVKLPRTAAGAASLRGQAATLTRLQADPRLGCWLQLAPEMLGQGTVSGQAYFVERALPGREGRLLLHDPAAERALHRAAAAAIRLVHQATAVPVTADDEYLDAWVERPVGQIAALAGQFRPALDAIAAELRAALSGAVLTVGWVHGDFWASNLLASTDGRRLTGVVDWDRAASGELAIMDVLHLLVQRRKLLARQREPGGAIAALLHGEGWTPFERELLATPLYRNTLAELGERRALLLYWLRMMAIYLEQDSSRAADAAWVLHNIEKVLR